MLDETVGLNRLQFSPCWRWWRWRWRCY